MPKNNYHILRCYILIVNYVDIYQPSLILFKHALSHFAAYNVAGI